MDRRPLLLAVLCVALVGESQAQVVPGTRAALAATVEPAAPSAGPSLLSENARLSLAPSASARPGRVVFGVMGGLIGAGAGFMLSQILHSDWEKSTNSTFATHRRNFAISGAAVGAAGAFLLDLAEPSPSDATPLLVRNDEPAREGSGGAITRAELAESPAQNAYDAVRSLRPQWLIERGETLASRGTLTGDARQPVAVEGTPRLGAFLDNTALGDVRSLREIPIATVERIEFLTGAVGQIGHVQRAIVVTTLQGL